jgi:16S rRNA (adenine1518-N6/adenine1519-N6)-dimethyltransferase
MPPPRHTGPASRASRYVRERARLEGGDLAHTRRRLEERGLSPRKRFGQNFLIREDIADRIVEHCHLRDNDVAVEIGAGAGALTPRLATAVRKLYAIEKDRGLVDLLQEDLTGWPHLEIVSADILEFDFTALARTEGVERIVVVGNIPYNITTPILEHLFAHGAAVRCAVLLVQKEYAERLGAAAGTPAYGSLTLFARYHALLEPLMRLKPSAFWPRPDVDSMLVRFFMRDHAPVEVPSAELLFRIIRGSFHMRRKQLMNTLQESLGLPRVRVERLCRHAGIVPQRRGETLTLEEFARLARAAADYLPLSEGSTNL